MQIASTTRLTNHRKLVIVFTDARNSKNWFGVTRFEVSKMAACIAMLHVELNMKRPKHEIGGQVTPHTLLISKIAIYIVCHLSSKTDRRGERKNLNWHSLYKSNHA